MRKSLLAAVLVAAPALLIACSSSSAPPLKGTVNEIEYEAAEKKTQKAAITKESCTKKKGSALKVCSTPTVGFATATATLKPECYELEIKLSDGSTQDVCDKAAYRVLNPGDEYDSSADYSKMKALR